MGTIRRKVQEAVQALERSMEGEPRKPKSVTKASKQNKRSPAQTGLKPLEELESLANRKGLESALTELAYELRKKLAGAPRSKFLHNERHKAHEVHVRYASLRGAAYILRYLAEVEEGEADGKHATEHLYDLLAPFISKGYLPNSVKVTVGDDKLERYFVVTI